jgi:hypothetical protein
MSPRACSSRAAALTAANSATSSSCSAAGRAPKAWNKRGIARRIGNKIRYLRNPVYRGKYSLHERLTIVRRLFTRALLTGGLIRMLRILRTLTAAPPRTWPQVLADWIAGLAMRDYIQRHFLTDRHREQRLALRTAAMLHKLCAAEVRRGVVEIASRVGEGGAHLQILLRGYVGRVFFTRAAWSKCRAAPPPP